MTDDSLIVKVIQKYHPEWEPPNDLGRRLWVKALCPFHNESHPSATISLEYNSFRCWACPVKGDAIAIIMNQEGVSYRAAVELATTISPGSNVPVPRKSARVTGRRVFGQPRAGDSGPGVAGTDKQVPTGIRSRTTRWT